MGTSKSLRHLSIRSYLVIYISIITLTLCGLIIGIYTHHIKKNAIETMSSYGKVLADEFAFTITDYIIMEEFGLLADFTESFSKRPNVASISITDENFVILADSIVKRVGNKLSSDAESHFKEFNHNEFHFVNLEDRKIELETPVTINERTIGYLQLVLSLDSLLARVMDVQKKGALITIGFWGIGVIISLLFTKKATRSLDSMMIQTEKIGHGDFGFRSNVKGPIELENLSTALNSMAGSIQDYQKEQEKKFRVEMELAEQQRSMEMLKSASQTMKTIMEAMPYGVIIVGKDKTIRQVSKAALNLLGYDSQDEIVGHRCHKSICPAGEGKCPILDLNMALDRSERVILKKDNQPIHILKSVVPVEIDGEEVLLEAVIDISERKKAEKELQQAFTKLKEVQEELLKSERLAAVGEASGRVAHEVLNPITSVLARLEHDVSQCGNFKDIVSNINEIFDDWLTEYKSGSLATYLETKNEDGTPYGEEDFNLLIRLFENISSFQDEREKDLEFLLKQIQRVVKIINALRESTRTQRSVTEVVVTNPIKESLELLEDSLNKRGIRITTDLPPELPSIQADETELIQVFSNLYRNAMQSIDEKGARKGLISTVVSLNNAFIEVRITDDGTGIPDPVKASLFDFNFTTKERDKGTGLGLGISRRLIRQIGGDLELEESTENIGTTFLITIPVKPKENPVLSAA